MARRKRPTSKKFKEKYPREAGKFYHRNDKSGGRPALVYESNPSQDIYLIQKFSTKPRKDRQHLIHNIDPEEDKKPKGKRKEQYLVKRPEAVSYDGITYSKKYKNYRVHEDDIPTVKNIKKNR